MMIMEDSKMYKIEYDLKAIMYSVYQLGYSAEEFQALQLIVLVSLGVVD